MSVVTKLWEVEALWREAAKRWNQSTTKEEEAVEEDFLRTFSGVPGHLASEWLAVRHGHTKRKAAEALASEYEQSVAEHFGIEPFDHDRLVTVIENKLTVSHELSRIGLEDFANKPWSLTDEDVGAALRDDVDRETGKPFTA